jgi:hypothetical protein
MPGGAAEIRYELESSRYIKEEVSQMLGRPFTVSRVAVSGAPEHLETALARPWITTTLCSAGNAGRCPAIPMLVTHCVASFA